MNVPHLTHTDRSDFYLLVHNALLVGGIVFPLTVPLGKPGGYRGRVSITIRAATEAEFEAELDLEDWTRFPARIRAAATALRDAGRFGTFFVEHEDGILKIARVAAAD